MQIKISGHDVDVTPALRQLTEKKFEKLKRHFNQITEVNITLKVEKLLQKAKATISIPGNTICANSSSEDMYKTIDALVGKLDKQIIKHKEETSNHHKED